MWSALCMSQLLFLTHTHPHTEMMCDTVTDFCMIHQTVVSLKISGLHHLSCHDIPVKMKKLVSLQSRINTGIEQKILFSKLNVYLALIKLLGKVNLFNFDLNVCYTILLKMIGKSTVLWEIYSIVQFPQNNPLCIGIRSCVMKHMKVHVIYALIKIQSILRFSGFLCVLYMSFFQMNRKQYRRGLLLNGSTLTWQR